MTDPRYHQHHQPYPQHQPQPTPPPGPGGWPGGGWQQQTQLDMSPPGGMPSGMPADPGGGAPRRRVPGWMIWLSAATAVLSVVAFVTVWLWPGGDRSDDLATGPLDFAAFTQVGRVEFGQSSSTGFTELTGDTAYVAWEQDGNLELVAADVATGAQRWQQQVTGSSEWAEIFPVPGAVVVVGDGADGDGLHLYVRDADSGQALWDEPASSEDWASASEDKLVWFQADRGRLRGVDIATGAERWAIDVSPEAASTWTLADEDLARPTDFEGYVGVVSTDHRLVVVNEDESAFVVDTRTGTEISSAAGIADPDDTFTAYEGRLYVAVEERGYELVSYGLQDLSVVPQVHYRAGPEQYPEDDQLDPCGEGRMCLLEMEGFSPDTTEVVAVDIADSQGDVWRQPVPDAQTVVPVGPWVLARGSEDQVTGYNRAGQEVLSRPGVVGRLNADNMLVFASEPSSFEEDVSVAGVTVTGDGPSVTELGQLSGVVSESCDWNVTHIACPRQEGVQIWTFVSS